MFRGHGKMFRHCHSFQMNNKKSATKNNVLNARRTSTVWNWGLRTGRGSHRVADFFSINNVVISFLFYLNRGILENGKCINLNVPGSTSRISLHPFFHWCILSKSMILDLRETKSDAVPNLMIQSVELRYILRFLRSMSWAQIRRTLVPQLIFNFWWDLIEDALRDLGVSSRTFRRTAPNPRCRAPKVTLHQQKIVKLAKRNGLQRNGDQCQNSGILKATFRLSAWTRQEIRVAFDWKLANFFEKSWNGAGH